MKRVLDLEKSVINDVIATKVCVINDGDSAEIRVFRDYANKVREMQKVRGVVMKNGWWWRRLSPDLRSFMLWELLKEEGLRYADADWAALPDNLRSRISACSRHMVRLLDGCPWR